MDKYISQYQEWIDSTWDKLDNKLRKTAVKSRNKIPYTTINGEHNNRLESDPLFWTNGFWGGLMWVMYLVTKNEEYKKTAEISEELLDKAFENFDAMHHDMGFLWNLTSGVNYRLTGNEKSKRRFCYAAAILASRYNISGGFIRAWNPLSPEVPNTGYSIIDCMMNIPLLYRASELNGDNRYRDIANLHAEMTMNDHIRPDGSVNHIINHNPNEKEVIEALGGQGYGKGSSWSRGQSWALYGFALAYAHTQKQEYLDIAKKVAHYFISNVAMNNYLPLVDFRAPEEPVIYDSTAGACAASGLIEIAKSVPEYEKNMYIDAVIKILMALEKNFCNWNEDEDSVLQMGTEAYHFGGRHIPIIYGDYFFAEALSKLKGNDFLMF